MAEWVFSARGDGEIALCTRFVDVLPITGAAVSVFGTSMPETAVCATDDVAARLEELQFDLGEGPRWQATRTRLPVFEPQVREGTHPQWPVFAEAIMETAVHAIYVFPLTLGALDVGVVELYSTAPGPLDRNDEAVAVVLADSTAWRLLNQLLTLNDSVVADAEGEAGIGVGAAGETTVGPPSDGSPLSRREIHQATGMVLVQTETNPTDALLLLRAHAFAHNQTVREVARDVVARRLVFTPDVV